MTFPVALLSLLLLAATPLPAPTPQATDATVSPKGNQTGNQDETAAKNAPTIQKHPSAHHTDEEGAENNQPSEILLLNRRLTEYTGNLANYTRLLVIVGILQFVGALLGVALLRSGHKLNRRLFAVTHRPIVHVRSVQVQQFDIPDFVNVSFTVVNLGGTEASVLRSQWNLTLDTNPVVPTDRPPLPPYGDRRQPMQGLPNTLRPGEAYEIKEAWKSSEALIGTIETEGQRWRSLSGDYLRGLATLYVLGYIKYRDTLGLIHKTAFCRRYVHTPGSPPCAGMLERANDPDYEYQE